MQSQIEIINFSLLIKIILKWVDESDSEILYVDTKKDAEEIIKKHNLDDARIILCTSDGRGDVNHLFNSYV